MARWSPLTWTAIRWSSRSSATARRAARRSPIPRPAPTPTRRNANANGPDSITFRANDRYRQLEHGDGLDHDHAGQRPAGRLERHVDDARRHARQWRARRQRCRHRSADLLDRRRRRQGPRDDHQRRDRRLHLYAECERERRGQLHFKANDGTIDSNTATVSVTITPCQRPAGRLERHVDDARRHARQWRARRQRCRHRSADLLDRRRRRQGPRDDSPTPRPALSPIRRMRTRTARTASPSRRTTAPSTRTRATISVTITPVNDPPVASSGT